MCEENNNNPFLIYTLLFFCFFLHEQGEEDSWFMKNCLHSFPQTHKINWSSSSSSSFFSLIWNSQLASGSGCDIVGGMNSTIFSSEIVNQLYPSSEVCQCRPLQEQPHSWFFGYVSLAWELPIIQLMSLGFLRYYPFDSLDLVFLFITYCNLYLLRSSSIFGKLTGYNIHFILHLPESLRISKVCLYGNKETQ